MIRKLLSDLNETELPVWKMTRNPFCTVEDIIPDNMQKFFDMKCNSTTKDDFEHTPLNELKKIKKPCLKQKQTASTHQGDKQYGNN